MRYFLPFRSLGALAALGFVWLLNFGARAQAFDWAASTTTLQPTSAARGLKTVSDASGNTYVTGNFTGTVAFGATILSSSGVYAAFVAKLDSSGNWLWARQAGGTSGGSGTGVAVDGSGNVLLTGYFQSPIASFGTTTLTNTGLNDIFVAKLDGSGNWLWARKAGGTGVEGGTALAVDGSGNVLLTGYFQSPMASFGTNTLINSSGNGSNDVFVAKIDGSGNWLWARKVGGTSGDIGRGVAVDGSGNVLLTGNFASPTVSFGTITLSGSRDMFVAKLDSSGNWLWARQAGGTGADLLNTGMAVDGSGNVLLTGDFLGSTASFGATTVTNSSSNGIGDLFVAKLDGSGNWLWARQAGGTGADRGAGVAVDGSGNVLLTGAFLSSTASFGTTTITNSSSGIEEIFLAKLDGSGSWLWARQVGGTGADTGFGLAVDGSDNVLLTGSFASPTVSFGGSITLTNGDGSDQVFVARLRGAGSPTALAPSAAAPAAGLAPNPAHEWVQFSGLPAAAPVLLVDVTGRLVRTRPAAGPGGAGVFPLTGVPAGVYVLRAGAVTRRLVVE